MEKTGFTIRRKIILPIIVLVIAVLGLFGLAACGEDMITEQDIIDRGYVCFVVYDYNGGVVNSTQNSAAIRVFKDSHIPEPGADLNKDFKSPSYAGHSLKGFYKAATRFNEETAKNEIIYDKYVEVTDASGNKTYEPYVESENASVKADEKKPVIVEFARASDEEWDFASGTVDSDLTIVAVWWENFNIELRCGEKVNNIEVPRQKNGDPNTVTARSMNISDTTILNYYLDSAKTNEIKAQQLIDGSNVFSIDREYFESSADNLTATVWCNYLDGIYQIVNSESSFASLSFSQDVNVYLDRDLDMTGRNRNFPDNYNGIFLGNGHTISNLKIEKSFIGTSYDAGMFNTLMSDAVLSDITFENVRLEIELSNATAASYTIGILAGNVRSGATVSDVHVSGTVSYKIPVGLDADRVTFDSSSLFGDVSGEAKVTDSSAAIQSYTGSEAAFTADKAYAVYVWYTVTGGVKEYGSAYALGSLNSSNIYRSVSANLTYDENNDVYTCKAARKNYTIKLTANGGGLSAEVTQS